MATTTSSAILSAALAGSRTAPFGARPPPAVSLAPGGARAGGVAAGRVSAVAAGKEREPRGIMKPRPVSPEMADFVGAPVIPRTQALKIIWAYIKEHNLQDPENKKIIVCDEKLKSIFAGQERVGFLEVAKLISPHFLK